MAPAWRASAWPAPKPGTLVIGLSTECQLLVSGFSAACQRSISGLSAAFLRLVNGVSAACQRLFCGLSTECQRLVSGFSAACPPDALERSVQHATFAALLIPKRTYSEKRTRVGGRRARMKYGKARMSKACIRSGSKKTIWVQESNGGRDLGPRRRWYLEQYAWHLDAEYADQRGTGCLNAAAPRAGASRPNKRPNTG
eukprot:352928-Chlamydomonas_euryale.AAC.3